MSLMVRKRNAPDTISVDEVDLTHLDLTNLRAVLLPKSESALYSTRLENNDKVDCPIKESIFLPSPCNSSSEDEGSSATLKSHAYTNSRRRRSQTVLILEQSVEKEKFTFGSSSDSDVVLKHPNFANEDRCYINLVQAQLYPDPDQDALILTNNSTSAFRIRSFAVLQVDDTILPGQGARLACGSWHLTFGEGLDFQIKVIPRTPREVIDNWSLISPSATINAFSAKLSAKVATSRMGSVGKEIGASRVEGKILVEPERPEPQLPLSSKREPLDPHVVIGKTRRTLVFKATRKEATVAIKVCRSPTVQASACTWRNEVEIMKLLSPLNHPSITKLLHYDARNLCIELEYGGQDLSKFVDKRRMSQLPEETSQQVWMDISNGMEHIHAHRILHLDIKPQNILLGEDGRAKICDFGISVRTAIEPIIYSGGTPTYISPEYVLDRKRGRADDVWAFGITMMFAFHLMPLPPVGNWKIANIGDNKGDTAKMLKWLSEVERSKESIPSKLFVLRKMLINNPSDRITFPELVSSLRATLQVKPLTGELFA